MIVLFVDSTNDIKNREPPLIMVFIPYRTNLIILIESDRYLTHN